MITEQDLQAAIAECEGQRNPNANTCIKLAAFYTIRDHLFPQEGIAKIGDTIPQLPERYSGSIEPEYESDTEFCRAVQGWSKNEMMPLLDELITAVSVLNPRLYAGFIRKLLDN